MVASMVRSLTQRPCVDVFVEHELHAYAPEGTRGAGLCFFLTAAAKVSGESINSIMCG